MKGVLKTFTREAWGVCHADVYASEWNCAEQFLIYTTFRKSAQHVTSAYLPMVFAADAALDDYSTGPNSYSYVASLSMIRLMHSTLSFPS